MLDIHTGTESVFCQFKIFLNLNLHIFAEFFTHDGMKNGFLTQVFIDKDNIYGTQNYHYNSLEV